MGSITKKISTAATRPELSNSKYSSYISDLILEWEPKFADDVRITLHLDQWSGIGVPKNSETIISEDKKQIDIHYQLGGVPNAKKGGMKSYDEPDKVIGSLSRLFEQVHNSIKENPNTTI